MPYPVAGAVARGEQLLGCEPLVEAVRQALAREGRLMRRCESRLIRASRSRPVVAFTVDWSTGCRSARGRGVVIAKGYYRGDGARTFDVMVELWAQGFADAPEGTIPRPLGFLPEPPVLLQGAVPAATLHDAMRAGTVGEPDLRRTARWLSRLHAMRVPQAAGWGVGDERAKLREYVDGLGQARPETASRVAALAEATLGMLADGGPDEQVPTHGDFQPKNIHLDGERVVVIDFDRFRTAARARDLGHFVGQTMTMSYVHTGSFSLARAWSGIFLDEYRRLAGPGADRLLAGYLARTFLEVLYYKLVVRPVRTPYFLATWLREAERLLAAPADLPAGLAAPAGAQ